MCAKAQNENTLRQVAIRNDMRREIAENPRYAQARKWALIIGGIWLALVIIDRFAGIVLLCAGYSTGTELDTVSQRFSPVLLFSLAIPLLVFMMLVTQNNVVFLNIFLLISGLGTILIGLASGDWISPVLGIVFLVLAAILWFLPMFKEYRKRTHEIVDAHDPRKMIKELDEG